MQAGRSSELVDLMDNWRRELVGLTGQRSWGRVDHMLEFIEGKHEMPALPPSAVPLPWMFLPGLTNVPVHEDVRGSKEKAKGAWQEVRRELLGLLEGRSSNFGPYQTRKQKLALDGTWNAFYFFRGTDQFVDNQRRCPATWSLIADLPHNRNEALFSVLEPGAELRTHSDYVNYAVTQSVGLIVPVDCGVRVADSRLEVKEGLSLFYETVFLHSAWNRSQERRIVLLLDLWHPDLEPIEIEALSFIHPQFLANVSFFRKHFGPPPE
jgi:aspartyl/asparaginyl beta-hydroxylase